MWFKGGLHIHSNTVDGKLGKSDLVREYRNNGFDFISFTDHNILSRKTYESDSDFLVIENSVEFNIKDTIMHVLGIGLAEEAAVGFKFKASGCQEMLDFLYLNDALTIICHPNWRWVSFGFKEISLAKNYHGIEIYNICLENEAGNTFAFDKWDHLLSCGLKIWGYAVDDYHDPAKDKPGRGFVMVNSASLDKKSILDSLKNGNFYSSTGLLVDEFCIEDNIVHVYSKECTEIILFGLNGKYLDSFEKNRASFKINSFPGYVRCELRSVKGAAFLQPFFNNI